ncbi:MAG: hypothetical protein WC565_06835 [Parcubacteria group bacterium]|jgi:hypothetical protein
MASLPSSLDECTERLDAAQTAVAKSQSVVRVLGGIALVVGIGWAFWEIIGRKNAEAKPEAPPEALT